MSIRTILRQINDLPKY